MRSKENICKKYCTVYHHDVLVSVKQFLKHMVNNCLIHLTFMVGKVLKKHIFHFTLFSGIIHTLCIQYCINNYVT